MTTDSFVDLRAQAREPHDELVDPTSTFSATAWAVNHCGGARGFVD